MDHLKPWYQRSSFWSAVIGTASLLLALRHHTWRAIPDEMVLGTLALWANFFGFQRASPSRALDKPQPPPPNAPLFIGFLVAVLATVVFSAACRGPYTPPPPPGPTPTPTPVPTPGPAPVPAGHVVTVAEYDAIVMGTTEAVVLERFGPPYRRSAVGLPGTSALVYPAKGPAGEDLVAEFWIRDGRVVTKNRL